MGKSSPEMEKILASLHRMALKVAKSPKADREAGYELMRASLGDAGRALNLSDKEMADFEANYMTWLRALVDLIERGGGAPGGRA